MITRCLNCMKEYDDEFAVCPHCGFVKGTKPKEVYHLHPGMKLANRYMIGTVIGFGGFGVVYKAWDEKLDIMVAVKEYFPAAIVTRTPGEKRVVPLGKSEKIKEYKRNLDLFIEEAKSTAKFSSHPNIINVFNFFEENGTAYMVMEYLEGMTLKEYLKEQPEERLDVNTTINILLSIISALKEVHKSGILHRDISPDNIFICTNNNIKLIDFGAAKFSDDELEKTREIVLKPGYAPPEQYQSKSIQAPWTDIYALAATMYRAITGVVPDESTNRAEEDKLLRPKELVPEIPDYIDAVLMRGMSVTPEFRFKNVQEFEDAILNKRVMRTEAEQRRFLLRRRLISVAVVVLCIGLFGLHTWRDYESLKVLSKTTITVWMPVYNEENEEAEAKFSGMTEEFQNDYKQVKVKVEYIPAEEYQSRLEEAFQERNAPTVFDGSYLTQDTMKNAASLKDVMKSISKSNYYFLNNYKKYFPEQKQMPLGFVAPLNYGNLIYMDEGTLKGKKNDLEKFLDLKTTFYVGGSDEYLDIQSALGGRYAVMPVLDGEVDGYFTDIWSVNNAGNEAQKKAGVRLIFYFLGENAQSTLYVENAGGLPLNKNILQMYESVNPEMAFLEDYIKRISGFIESKDEEYYDSLYGKQFTDSGDETLKSLNQWLDEEE